MTSDKPHPNIPDPDSVTHFLCPEMEGATHHLAPRPAGRHKGEAFYEHRCDYCGRTEKHLRERNNLN